MDRFTKGLIAGIIGGIVMNGWSTISYFLDITELRFMDWTSIFIYGNLPSTAMENLFALVVHLFFVGILGVIFAYLITKITTYNYYLKAVLFGVGIAFILYAIPTLFKVPHLMRIELKTIMSNYFGASLWGLTMAYVLRKLDKKVEI